MPPAPVAVPQQQRDQVDGMYLGVRNARDEGAHERGWLSVDAFTRSPSEDLIWPGAATIRACRRAAVSLPACLPA